MLAGRLTEEQAVLLAGADPDIIRLALLAANARIAKLAGSAVSPTSPSAATPVHLKPRAAKTRAKKPGAKVGHAGSRRQTPEKIDAREDHRLDACPCCGGGLQRCDRTRTRIIEDIPEKIEPVVTEHTIHRDYCPSCKKHVEPVVPDAMPNATLGHNVVVFSSNVHYGLGLSIGQTREILGSTLHTPVTAGGLVSAWNRMAEALMPWYEQIATELRATACLNADETGWRVDGATHWLWCFCDIQSVYFMIDRSRGGPALQKFFAEAFDGTLVTDFWSAYEQVTADDRQFCLAHLLRELDKVDERNVSPAWRSFAKQLRRLVHDGIRLRKRPDFTPAKYASRISLINRRLIQLANDSIDGVYADGDAERLGERISRHRDHLFTFLDKPQVPYDNNHAERQIRPAVIMRKNILCNRSDGGAQTQAVLMSIYRTLKLRGHDPTKTIVAALRECMATGKLPPLPAKAVAGG